MTNRGFWVVMKTLLINKCCLDNTNILPRVDNGKITDDKRLAKLYNEHYFNILELSNGLKSENIVSHDEDFDKRIILILKFLNTKKVSGN